MTSNSTTIDSLSIFTFKDAVNYFNGLQCNSNKDCPLESDCISHKCILPFYCKDDNNCAFYETLCDGKPCYKGLDFKCKANTDCLSGSCIDPKCGDNTSYYSGTFSLEDGSNYIKQYLNQCRDKECSEKKLGLCKGQTGRCEEELHCKDPTMCSVYGNVREGLPYDRYLKCRTNDECLSGVCSYGNCVNSDARFEADLNSTEYGMFDEGKCFQDKDCYYDHKCFNGVCKSPESIQSRTSTLFIIICVVIVIIAALAMCCCRRRKNRKN
ncbi:hypothetical protein BCR32DRAFT_280243 [Anaeromyces robustus]|uniref:Uncharacterized protein n=1 Tax=Anaeromyces robustus TaxID=1754192 RepID=A0A1Y1X572_9FUNG|nr:hypothetical protein BCR32DRAFT_280243 [Anaeromyces robustus]|eukprot:ORX80795.1 hypothetical protein BCR32DRAFT_280243 [Anaeromyces robustus]